MAIAVRAIDRGGTIKVCHSRLPHENAPLIDLYTAATPNGRIPAIVEHDADDFAVFESGAILFSNADQARRFAEQARGMVQTGQSRNQGR